MRAKLKSCEAKAEFFEEALKMSRKEVDGMRAIAKNQKARLDTASAKMAELNEPRDKAIESTATCRNELLRVQNNLAAALVKVKGTLACVIVVVKNLDAVAAKYDNMRSSV